MQEARPAAAADLAHQPMPRPRPPRRRRCRRLPSATMPRLRARAEGPSPALMALLRVVAAKPLFSQTNRIGSELIAAQLRPSRKGPRLVAPSPKKQTTICARAAQLDRMGGTGGDHDVGADHAVRARACRPRNRRCASSRPCLCRSRLPCRRARASSAATARPWRAYGRGRGASTARCRPLEVGADADRHRLLADRRMDRAQHQLLLHPLDGSLLEAADAQHLAIEMQQPLDADWRRPSCCRQAQPIPWPSVSSLWRATPDDTPGSRGPRRARAARISRRPACRPPSRWRPATTQV